MKWVAFIVLVLSGTANIYCQSPKDLGKFEASAVRIERDIKLSGKLDDPLWNRAKPIELNFEIMPGDNIPASEKTKVKILYNDEYIYFGFECFDSNPSLIRANYSDRDKIYDDDYVQVLIDTYRDYQKGYSFSVNPFGIKGDLLLAGADENLSSDWVWEAEASKNDKGWTAEIAIPFSIFSFSKDEKQVWGLHLFRNIPRESKTSFSWSKIDRNNIYLLPQEGLLSGLDNISSNGKWSLLPYVLGEQTALRNGMGTMKYDNITGRLGFGIKYIPNSNTSYDAVVNPDFSQIESDADQISVNTTFALHYDEKRPFFLEGNEMFSTPYYYSRSINDPLGAVKTEGKSGSFSYYLMTAYDRNTPFIVAGAERSNTVAADIKSLAGVARARYEFGNESYLGGMLLTRNFSGGHGYNSGIDWRVKFWDNYYFLGEFFLSNVKELNDTTIFNSSRKLGNTSYNAAFNGEEYTGTSLMARIMYNSRSYRASYYYTGVSPLAMSYVGSLSGNGYQQLYVTQKYLYYPQNSIVDRSEYYATFFTRWNSFGQMFNQGSQITSLQAFKGQTTLTVGYYMGIEEIFNNVTFKGVNYFTLSVSSLPLDEISVRAEAQFGKMIYRSSNPKLGNGHNVSASVTLKPDSKLNVSFSYSRAELRDFNTDQLFYTGNIYRLVGIYQFSSELFFRTILQYNTFENTYQVYPLISYKLNAFTTFYAGATSEFSDFTGNSVIVNTGQQYFIKLQYLLGI